MRRSGTPEPGRQALLRAAILPAFEFVDEPMLRCALRAGGAALKRVIHEQRVASLWHARLGDDEFLAARHAAALLALAQRHALRELAGRFDTVGIDWMVIKGAAVREAVYDSPEHRPGVDVDVLVDPAHRGRAIGVLLDLGYATRVNPDVASHEITLRRAPVSIDLHWDILRPGRMRVPMTPGLLERRPLQDGIPVPSDTDSMFLMLVHSAFNKHVSGATNDLRRAIDIVLWLQRRKVDWPEVHRLLADAGVRTAAWAVLTWVRNLSPAEFHDVVDPIARALAPRQPRAGYLRFWLRHDMPRALSHRRLLRLVGFSLLLHDGPDDMLHAVRGWNRALRSRTEDSRALRALM